MKYEKIDVASLTAEKLAKTIDHAMLRPNLTRDDIKKGCELALKYKVAAVCVNPYYVDLCVDILKGSGVKVSAVVAFPFGQSIPEVKAAETKYAIEKGAEELDMVINVAALKNGDHRYVVDDIRKVVEVSRGALVKVILENCYLTDDEKIKACRLAEEAGAHYVKTSTGFGSDGAKVEDVKLMYKTVGPRLGIKAAGGIRSLNKAIDMLKAGATRLGVSATEKIMEEMKKTVKGC
ncbi:MAG TPA: deoxyribose-phosphate aldolase [Candidatus Aerophobetes bacterium]|uniref:Deoxyribose-phosphate aldolase n=1 Tax=Aerophobetes bacterium TaxID=2030807 RepID=A0A7V0MZ53_UNCAE|nr:deoxyribose-phosphate aldolase [Candidatus Aerophobetes bacterium]